MTAEGVFPKVDGDILYASNVNGFYNLTGSPVFQNTTGSMFYHGAGAVTGSLVFTGISGICMYNIMYCIVPKDNAVQDLSFTSLYPNVKINQPDANMTSATIISKFFPINNNGSYVINPSINPAGSVLIGSFYLFGGQPGATITSSW